MKKSIRTLMAVSLVALLFVVSCSSVSRKKQYDGIYSRNGLQKRAESVLNEEELKRFKVPYAVTPDLVAMAQTIVDRRFSDIDISKKLALMLLRENEGLGINYSRNTNFTAIEVYRERSANCISYTNLFIGMARSIGLNAQYAEVTEVDSFSKVGGMVVYNSHICAVVHHGPKPFIVDFSLRRYPQYHSWRAITDLEAAASFYNNIGSQYILKSSSSEAFKEARIYFNMSLKLFPKFVQAYNNLGVLKLREGKIDEAEAMYQKALEIKPGYFAAYANLGNVYMGRGETEKAVKIMIDAIKASPENHFAYLSTARMFIVSQDFKNAEKFLLKALRVNKRFTDARHELGRLYLHQGRGEEAKKQFALALKYQPDDDLAVSKMELIDRLAAAQSDQLP